MSDAIRSMPCEFCPYRQDVPSGVWARSEYDKLRAYDAPTAAQPMAGFACHTTPDLFCHGWAVVHSTRGHEHELLALRMKGIHADDVPDAGVPLMFSGNDAADHGEADIDTPSQEAREAADRLTRKHDRLRWSDDDRADAQFERARERADEHRVDEVEQACEQLTLHAWEWRERERH